MQAFAQPFYFYSKHLNSFILHIQYTYPPKLLMQESYLVSMSF